MEIAKTRYYRIEDLMTLLGGISRPTLDRIRKSKGFPKGLRISRKITLWEIDAIESWLESKRIKNEA